MVLLQKSRRIDPKAEVNPSTRPSAASTTDCENEADDEYASRAVRAKNAESAN